MSLVLDWNILYLPFIFLPLTVAHISPRFCMSEELYGAELQE